ncbi:MAG: hypothetical protein PWP03_840 [Candidatus Woesearchaeota archaeon]|nr:hypothetical protein [Candidatus Woesearchaeota archaeon]MDN5328202.1 hypothetical protein [Candidatus Woesearchaeota archaeon]
MKNSRLMHFVVLVVLTLMLLKTTVALEFKTVQSPEEVCQCFASAYKITIINDELSTKSLHIFSEDNEVNIVPEDLKIEGKDSKSILVFLTPECDKKPGDYEFTLNVADEQNKSYTFKQKYKLKECRAVDVKTKDIETCVKEPITESFEVSNKGKVKEDLFLNVSKGDIETEVSLNPLETKEITFKSDGFQNPGEYSVKLNYKTEDNYISGSDTFKIKVDPCSSFEATLTKPQDVCLGESAKLLLTITNTGKIDEVFKLSSDDIKVPSEVRIAAGNSKVITLNVTPSELGEKDIVINIDSKYAGNKKLYSKVTAKNCCGVSLISSPTPIEICAGTKAEISVLMSVLNNGIKSEFEIESDSPWLTPELNDVVLGKNEVKEFVAKVKPLNKAGEYRAIIRAKNDYCEDKAFVTLDVKNCYDLEAELEDNTSEACANQKLVLPLKIKNTGEADSTYDIKVLNPKELMSEADSIELSKGQEGKVNLFLNTSNLSGDVTLEVVVSNHDHPEIKKVIKRIIEVEKCYDFDMSLQDIDACTTQNIELTGILTNKGTKDDEYTLDYICPSWINPKTDKVFLKSGENAKIKLEGTVPLEASGKKSLCSIIVKSTKLNTSKIFKSNINVKDNDECFCTKAILNMDKINVEVGKSKVVNVEVENCGLFNQTYTCKVSDELKDFAYITPDEFKLSPKESDRCYIGFIPKDSSKKEIAGDIIVSNGITEINKPITINIIG